MTVAIAVQLQQEVFAAVSAAVAPMPVFDHPPVVPPSEFVRLDGFSISDLSPKNGEVARHAFEIHHFLRPTAGATVRGQTRTKQVLAAAHAAIMSALLCGTRADFEYQDVQPDEDGVSMHGRARYTIVL